MTERETQQLGPSKKKPSEGRASDGQWKRKEGVKHKKKKELQNAILY